MPNRYVLGAGPAGGPCSTSETHSSPGAPASNRPKTSGAAAPDGPVSSIRTKCRWMVRTEGTCPAPSRAARIRCTCAAVRSGFSFFSATASSSTPALVRGCTPRLPGTRASKPPARQSRIHRSSVDRPILSGCPPGSLCCLAASARTSTPRCRGGRSGSAAARISP